MLSRKKPCGSPNDGRIQDFMRKDAFPFSPPYQGPPNPQGGQATDGSCPHLSTCSKAQIRPHSQAWVRSGGLGGVTPQGYKILGREKGLNQDPSVSPLSLGSGEYAGRKMRGETEREMENRKAGGREKLRHQPVRKRARENGPEGQLPSQAFHLEKGN